MKTWWQRSSTFDRLTLAFAVFVPAYFGYRVLVDIVLR